MRTFNLRLCLAGLALAGSLGLLLVDTGNAGNTAKLPTADNKYIGAKKCKSCHSKEEVGNQYGAWEKAEHSKAFEHLASEAALAAGKEKGVAEPQKAPECLKCHTTAYGVPEDQIARGFKAEMGVQCESCHGPGEAHMKARFKAAAAGDAEGPVVIPEGEIILDPPQETCRGCHNSESPTFEKFCYYRSKETIRHLKPGRSEEELAKILVSKYGDDGPCVDACVDDCPVPAGEK